MAGCVAFNIYREPFFDREHKLLGQGTVPASVYSITVSPPSKATHIPYLCQDLNFKA